MLCKICLNSNCLGIGKSGDRSGKRCSGTLETEAHPRNLTNDQLDEIIEYQLECFYDGKAGLPFNGRYLLSMIKEIKEYRKNGC